MKKSPLLLNNIYRRSNKIWVGIHRRCHEIHAAYQHDLGENLKKITECNSFEVYRHIADEPLRAADRVQCPLQSHLSIDIFQIVPYTLDHEHNAQNQVENEEDDSNADIVHGMRPIDILQSIYFIVE